MEFRHPAVFVSNHAYAVTFANPGYGRMATG